MLTLVLDRHWSCDYFEVEPDLYEFQDYRVSLTSLQDWQFERRFPESWAAWLERRFDLHPIDTCVHYVLSIDAAPEGTALSVNGRQFGAISAPCRIDITDFVTLDENRIAFRVHSGSTGRFGTVRLTAVPCED
jgi:hypothetical protein